jgi:phosphatidylglycerol:prolipoprotein diacylglycerol transferase
MIPYLAWNTINFGPIHLQVWGLFVGLGFVFGAFMAAWLAKRQGQDGTIAFDILPWLIFAGIVGGRLGHVLFYEPSYFWQHPDEIIAIWHGGLSMFGGLIASAIVGLAYLRYRKVNVLTHADFLLFGMPFGIWIGRIGCFLIHDHPGTATHFILGTKYPDGVVRHDLGLYESLAAGFLAVLFVWLARKPRRVGTYAAVFCLWYGLVRFFFDFLRINDAQYFGLTPAQYLSLGLILFGVGLAVWIRKGLKKP